MKNKNFIRMNVNDKYLSLGNFFRVVKEMSNNSNSFIQTNLFSIIFNTDNVADSTVNNYCTGFRAINPKFKEYFKKIKSEYEKDKTVLLPTIKKILELVEDKEISKVSLKRINESNNLKYICEKLYSISKNDLDVNNSISNKLYKYIENNELYEFICEVLFYIILEKKQPIIIDNGINYVIEKNIYNTNISVNDIQDFLNIQLNSGIWAIREIKELANKNNPFACFEMASMECYGIITGNSRYEKAYEYYKIAAKYNHPAANWAIGYLYYYGHIGNRTKRDLYLALKYFNKARKLKCSNAYNSLGIIYLNGDVPHIKCDKSKAVEMFKEAISLGNIYAYNNLGKIYEEEKEYNIAYECYLTSANLGESWAANKVGEYNRRGIAVKKDLKKAFEYYNKSSESPVFTLCKWSKYNLAKYFYKDGNMEVGITKDINKSIELLEDVCDDFIEALEELIYIYYELYLFSNKKEKLYLDKINLYKQKCELCNSYNIKIKSRIEEKLNVINDNIKSINIPK